QGADVDQHRIDARKGKSEEHGTPRVEWRCDGVFRPSAVCFALMRGLMKANWPPSCQAWTGHCREATRCPDSQSEMALIRGACGDIALRVPKEYNRRVG